MGQTGQAPGLLGLLPPMPGPMPGLDAGAASPSTEAVVRQDGPRDRGGGPGGRGPPGARGKRGETPEQAQARARKEEVEKQRCHLHAKKVEKGGDARAGASSRQEGGGGEAA